MGNTLKGAGALFASRRRPRPWVRRSSQSYIANTYRAVAAVPGVASSSAPAGQPPNSEQYQTLLPDDGHQPHRPPARSAPGPT